MILTDANGEPHYALNADSFLRSAIFEERTFNPVEFCHKPIIIRDPDTLLGEIISHLKVHSEHAEDDVVDHDIILLWSGEHRKIITGSDVLGRLLRGIAKQENAFFRKVKPVTK